MDRVAYGGGAGMVVNLLLLKGSMYLPNVTTNLLLSPHPPMRAHLMFVLS